MLRVPRYVCPPFGSIMSVRSRAGLSLVIVPTGPVLPDRDPFHPSAGFLPGILALRVRNILRGNGTFIAPLPLTRRIILEQELGRVATPEEHCLECRPHLLVSPVFAEDVGGIGIPRQVVELDGSRCNRFTRAVV